MPGSPTQFSEKDGVSVTSTAIQTHSDSMNSHNSGGTDACRLDTLQGFNLLDLTPRLDQDVSVPADFGPNAFDLAEREIKYMVLTNTWPKFVGAGLAGSKDGSDKSAKQGKEWIWKKVARRRRSHGHRGVGGSHEEDGRS